MSFQEYDAGEMWLPYNDKNQKEVTFIAGGDEWKPDANAIVALKDAFLCIREFLDNYEDQPVFSGRNYRFHVAELVRKQKNPIYQEEQKSL